jgi:hypothetical protein
MQINSLIKIISFSLLVVGFQCVRAEIIMVPDDIENIQGAINESDDGDTVLVEPGEYVENIDFCGKNIVVCSLFLFNGDEEFIERTIINGNGEGGVVAFDEGETRDAVLTGFTLLNGNRESGGGILCRGSEPTLTHLIIRDNFAELGGGIYCRNFTNPLIQHVLIIENSSERWGGGVFCGDDGNFVMEDCLLDGNFTGAAGGGVAIMRSDPILRRVTVLRNAARDAGGAGFIIVDESRPTLEDVSVMWNFSDNGCGGGIYINDSEGTYRNLIVLHNTAGMWGGGIHIPGSRLTIERVLIAFNFAESGGGAITSFGGTRLGLRNVTMYGNISQDGWGLQSRESEVAFVNCIYWGNQPTEMHGDGITATYSDIQDGFNGEGNIDAEPLFVDPDDDDFHLSPDSPCIDAGDPDSDPDSDGTRADIGAFPLLNLCAIQGLVLTHTTNEPIANALVTTDYGAETFTNENGRYILSNVFHLIDFELTASYAGYNDSTLACNQLEVDDTLEVNFQLLHPELILSTEEFNETVLPESSIDLPFTVINEGNGPLEWSMNVRLPGEMGVDNWGLRRWYDASQALDDGQLRGVVFIEDRFYVSGDNDGNPTIYIFDIEGEFINSFEQPGEDDRGFKDLAFHGELIWGSIRDQIYGISSDGEVIHNWASPFNPTTSVAYDIDHDILWISSTTSGIIGYDRAGNRLENRELDRQDLRIYGLAYWREDSDDCNLYIFNKERDTNQHFVHKINPDGGDIVFVAGLDLEAGGSPAGAFITDQYDTYGGWVFMDVIINGADDRVDIWQLQPNLDWITVEPSTGVINPGANQELELTLNTTGLDSTQVYEGDLVFSQSVGGEDRVVPVVLTIGNQDAVDCVIPQKPEEFLISSIYPNPFNSTTKIEYALPYASDVTLNLYNLSGQKIEILVNGRQQAGLHQITLNACNTPSGLYFMRLEGSRQSLTRKIMLVK